VARRGSFFLSTVVTLLAGGLVAVTGACSSLPDLHFDDGTEGGGGEGGPFAEGGEGGQDGGSDGGSEATVACPNRTAEICDDGIDNDCNGMTDCADPACFAGFSCVDGPPTGWDLVAFTGAGRPACPTSFTSPTDLRVVAGTTAQSCACTCTGSGGTVSCGAGMTAITVGSEPTCTTGPTNANLPSNAAACTALPVPDINVTMGTPYGQMIAPLGPAVCAANPTTTKTNAVDGRVCAPPATAAKGCGGAAQRCLPKPAGFTMCISQAGAQTCPAGYTNPSHAGSMETDGRQCTACTCGLTPCTGTIELWSNSMCNAKELKLSSANNTTCNTGVAVSDSNFTAKYFKSTVAGGCGVATAPTAQGGLTFTDERTICCK
jgi:hypothetical protein